MASDLVRARRRAALAVSAFVLVAGAFSYAFYYFDGLGAVEDIRSGRWLSSAETSGSVEPEVREDPLAVLEGIPDSVVLRLWQEQTASQGILNALIGGEILAATPATGTIDAASAEIPLAFERADGATEFGTLVFERVDGRWLLVTVRPGASAGESGSRQPSTAPVDRAVVAAAVTWQLDHQDAYESLLAGDVTRIDVLDVTEGLGTMTVGLRLRGADETSVGALVLITPEGARERHWYIGGLTDEAREL